MHLTYFNQTKRRILIILLSFICLCPSPANAQQLKLSCKETPLKTVLKEITRQTGYSFAYSDALKQVNTSITCNINSNEPIAKVLSTLLNGKGISFTITGKQIILAPDNIAIKDDGTTQKPRIVIIKGKVTDETGEPLPGAAIQNKSTGKYSAADLDGAYSIEAVPGDMIMIRSIGMKDLEQEYAGKSNVLNVVLLSDIVKLDDVIVTGYQTISKERSAGSYAIVKGDKVSDNAVFRGDLGKSLEGVSAGLSVNSSDGEQGVTMRGLNSLNSNKSVLYVVDGVAMEESVINNMINYNDVNSITFLKDATAASIWGARAANGVVVITTKNGSRNKKVEITYDGSFTYKGTPDLDYFDNMSSDMYVKNMKEIFNPKVYTWDAATTTTLGAGGKPQPLISRHEQILYDHSRGLLSEDQMNKRLGELSSLSNKEQIEKYLYSKKMRTSHSLTLSGGSNNYRYYTSMLYEYNQNENRGKDNRYAINLKQEINLTKWLTLDGTINVSYLDKNTGAALINTSPTSLLPYAMLKDENGNNLPHTDLLIYDGVRQRMEKEGGVSLAYTPLDELSLNSNKSNILNVRTNVGAKINLFKGLTFDSRYQYQSSSGHQDIMADEQSYETRLERLQFTARPTAGQKVGKAYLPSKGSVYTNAHTLNSEWTFRNQFIYDNTFAKKHQLNILAGTEVRNSQYKNVANKVRGYNPQTLTFTVVDEATLGNVGVLDPVYPNSGYLKTQMLTKNSFTTGEIEKRFVSFYGNASYSFDSKYTLNASLRVDQSNLFGSDPSVQFRPLWAVGGAWNMKGERFLKDVSFLSMLSLRASYGLGGNSPDPGLGGPYDILLPATSMIFPNLGYNVITPANDKLTWEQTTTFNIGVDFGFLKNRLTGKIEFYNRKTTDLLAFAQTNPVTGWESALSNIGSLYNRGIEVTLSSVNIQNSKFRWSTDFVFTYNKNKITELYDKEGLLPGNMIYKTYVENYSASSLFAFQWAGLDKMGDPQAYDNGKKVKLIEDMENLESVPYLGTTQPKFFGALTNTFSFCNFDLSFMLVYNLGHKMRNDVNDFRRERSFGNIHKDFDQRWRQEGDVTNVPSYVTTTNDETKRRYYSFYKFADINVLSASYIKLRDLTLSYSLPERACAKIGVGAFRIKFQVGDLFTITSNKEGIDPEYFNLRGGYRTAKFGPSYSFGINLRFR